MVRIDTVLPCPAPLDLTASRPPVNSRIEKVGHLRIDGKFFANGQQRLRLQGVTYGPFVANADGDPFPTPERVRDDFTDMRAAGINSIRTYHMPPEWLLDQAFDKGVAVLVDVPWRKHLCFLDSEEAQREARQAVHQVAKRGATHSCPVAYSIGNEIPSNIVRWHGARRVERFLAELGDVAKQISPDGLVTYANYPPTEYLDLSFLDFATFNVYLHDLETFRRYLLRLQNLVGDRPLVLGELGMDTLRHGELAQADYLSSHLRDVALAGLAGAFVFSWTDEWHTGGHPVRDWAFGITTIDRSPKPSYHALREVFEVTSPSAHLPSAPRVSVVVCSYNGGSTLEQCVRSLLALDYPDFEVIVVDDGSTDNTRALLTRYPHVRAIHQENQGLSMARNVGLQAATGTIVAYTDSDCFADADWLTHLVDRLVHSDAAAVGGPNLTPDDGWLAACVAAAPGQPVHVLESDQVAEHIPGCNMAFRRDALLAINGFDPFYRKAGDDVDVCWRLQQSGRWITFAPGAFVWHHRRHSPRAYLRQQAGYGEAEALLRFKHPDKFNHRGDGKWQGVIYGISLSGLRVAGSIIYRGTFGSGLFQCLYQPGPAHWAMIPVTLEWHLIALAIMASAYFWPLACVAAGLMLLLSFIVARLQAAQARLEPQYEGLRSRLLVTALCYVQPLVRSCSRYRTRLFSYRAPLAIAEPSGGQPQRLPLSGTRTISYWGERDMNRLQLLRCVIEYLNEHRWGKTLDSGWSDWDLEVYCHPWTVVQICTNEEDHGGGCHLVRVRFRMRTSGYLDAMAAAALLGITAAAAFGSWITAAAAGSLLAGCLALWWSGAYRAARAVAVVDKMAEHIGFIRCEPCAMSARPGCERRRRASRLARWLDRLLLRS